MHFRRDPSLNGLFRRQGLAAALGTPEGSTPGRFYRRSIVVSLAGGLASIGRVARQSAVKLLLQARILNQLGAMGANPREEVDSWPSGMTNNDFLMTIRAHVAIIGQVWAEFERVGTELGQIWPGSGPKCLGLNEIGIHSADIVRIWPGIDPTLERISPNLGSTRPDSGRCRQTVWAT